MNWLNTYTKGDKTIWIIVMILSLVSLLAVYSSTGTLAYKNQQGNTQYYLFKHLIILLFGIVLMFITHRIPYNYYSRLAQIALYITIPLLLITLLTGTNLNQASRWISLPGTNLTFQTSDFAKLALIMYVARILAKKQENIKDFRSAFLPVMFPVILVCGLILPANFSTAAVLFTTCLFLMFIGRVNMKYIFIMIATGAICLSGFIFIALNSDSPGRVATWKNRIENFTKKGDADASYQVDQAQIAIATGGLFGKGPGHSSQRNFLPHPYSDFIYAIIIEEYGLWGGFVIVFLYLILLARGVMIVNKSPKTFASLLAVGCSFSLVFQALINMAVAVHLFPVTGQTLPLVSMGGTSLWFTSIAIGILLSVSRDIEKEEGGDLAIA
jgi:cell division protein FtsW